MKLFALIAICSWSTLNAQVLDNRLGQAFTGRPFFNADFIQTNNIKSFIGSYIYKKTGDVMRNTTYKHVYNFDTLGRLESSYETRKDDGSKDTSWNIYTYDDRSNLIRHKWTDLDGYQIIEYTYDSLDRVIQEHYSREYIDSAGNIERSLSFNTETSEYADYDRQTKRTHYNNYNLPYLDEFHNYNELGYLVERVERIKMTSTVYTYDYSYNEQGKLAAIRKSSNQHEGFLEEHLFEYDELGNLIEKHEHRNGEFITDIQIIYNSKSKLISSVLTKQVSTGFFLILRFHEYEFYD